MCNLYIYTQMIGRMGTINKDRVPERTQTIVTERRRVLTTKSPTRLTYAGSLIT